MRAERTGGAAADEPLLRLEGISKAYGKVAAVEPLDLEIRGGDFFAILGPSGCGKTTLLRMIGGFIEPTTGGIVIRGRDVTPLGAEKRPTNMVFQGYGLFPHMTVRQNIGYGLRSPACRGGDRAAARGGDLARAPRRVRPPFGRGALGRPAAARGAGARTGDAAAGAAPRRAACRARPEAAPRDAGRAPPHPCRRSAARSCSSRTTRAKR